MSNFRGVAKLRRTLRRLDPDVTEGIKRTIENGARDISNEAAYRANSLGLFDTGDMIQSITYKLGRDGMTAVIGPGAKHVKISKNPFDTTQYVSRPSKQSAMNFFKAYWAEFGTKGDPTLGIAPQPATPFMNPAYDNNKDWIVRKTRQGISAALRDATRG